MNLRQLNLNHLYYFHCIASEGSIKDACKRLFVTQPTLSGQLKLLESYLGFALFERRYKKLVLTQKGREVFAHTRKIFDACEELLRKVETLDQPRAQYVRIGLATSVPQEFIVRVLSPLMRSPDLELKFETSLSSTMYEKLLTGELDLLISDELPEKKGQDLGIERRILFDSPYVLICSAGSAIDASNLLDPAQSHSLLISFRGEEEEFKIKRWLRGARLLDKVKCEFDDYNTLKSAVADGLGIGLIPAIWIEDEINSSSFRELSVKTGLRSRVLLSYQDESFEHRIPLPAFFKHAKERPFDRVEGWEFVPVTSPTIFQNPE